MKRLIANSILVIVFLLGMNADAQTNILNGAIPDAIFRNWVNENIAEGTGVLTSVQAAEYTGKIDVSGLGISDLSGIDFFTHLTVLDCSNNPNLPYLDVRHNTALTKLMYNNCPVGVVDLSQNEMLNYLDCSNSFKPFSQDNLTLDVRNNLYLNYLDCSNNGIGPNLDLSYNSYLTSLDCSHNSLGPNLDLCSNADLMYLDCSYNKIHNIFMGNGLDFLQGMVCSHNFISTLDLSSSVNYFNYLDCSYNSLGALNVRENINLSFLECSNNAIGFFQDGALNYSNFLTIFRCSDNYLTSLNVKGMAGLIDLRCSNNMLKSLDVSKDPLLNNLDCSKNKLTSLNIANGNNRNFTGLNTRNNPALNYISTDTDINKLSWITTNWTPQNNFLKDSTTNFTLNSPAVIAANEIRKVSVFSDTQKIQISPHRILNGQSLNSFSGYDIYPNPNEGIFMVSFSSKDANDYTLKVIDILGNTVIKKNLKSIIGNNQYQFNLIGINRGVYFLFMQMGDTVVEKKLLIQ